MKPSVMNDQLKPEAYISVSNRNTLKNSPSTFKLTENCQKFSEIVISVAKNKPPTQDKKYNFIIFHNLTNHPKTIGINS